MSRPRIVPQQVTPLCPTQAGVGGHIIESRPHVHVSSRSIQAALEYRRVEAVIRQWPCGSLWDDTGQYHPHLWGARSYFCPGAGNARKMFAGVSCSEG